jgi:hypothetical protein
MEGGRKNDGSLSWYMIFLATVAKGEGACSLVDTVKLDSTPIAAKLLLLLLLRAVGLE